MKLFIHRSGRTARAGQKGTSYALVTPDEVAYMHDLSAYCGRKYMDEDKDGSNIVEDPTIISYGKIPQEIIDIHNERYEKLIKRQPLLFKPFLESIKKSLQKYNRTRDPASNLGMQETHGLVPKIHPVLLDRVDKKQQELADFKALVSGYKPRAAAIELGLIKAKDDDAVSMIQKVAKDQQNAVKAKQVRIDMQKKLEKERDHQMHLLEQNQIELSKWEKMNNEKLEVKSVHNDTSRMSKKRRMKMEKV